MATLPVSVDEIIAKWGPHKHYMTKESARARASQTADEFVKTHCCFCGLQCGIKLKVKDKKVVGFEPWREFPFNEGRLCPKGVQRYMQDNHPDHLCTGVTSRLVIPCALECSAPDTITPAATNQIGRAHV